ncbi:MAG TPA: hypothetical protein VNQ31_03750 [Sphingomonadaceae bacterium]|nr:hypothetical protein [Sphingomonadaceae bacterium]
MTRMSILALLGLFGLFTPVLPAGSAAVGDAPGDARLIMMFGARWCAPCMAEYRRLAALVPAAAPDRIALAWVDRPIAPPPAVARLVGSVPAAEARRFARLIGGDGYGLPFAAMFDSAERPCAVWRGALDAAAIAGLRARCAARPDGVPSPASPTDFPGAG